MLFGLCGVIVACWLNWETGRRGRDRMLGFTTTCAISANHH
jgi:hypothetical protein